MNVTIFLVRLLVLAVIFINGWTDAPNAIATAVGSGALTFRRGVWLAAACNFLGTFLSAVFFPAVAATMSDLIVFPGGTWAALTALCAAMLSILLWAVLAWRFGLPTSESHALMAGLCGAALALGGQAARFTPARGRGSSPGCSCPSLPGRWRAGGPVSGCGSAGAVRPGGSAGPPDSWPPSTGRRTGRSSWPS